MIGTIRKHSKLLWGITIPALIISLFMFFLPQTRNGGGGRAGGDFGSINGKQITQQEFQQAVNEFKLFYFFNNGTWPDQQARVTEKDIEQQAYIRVFLLQKADELGIHAGLDAAAAAANQMLHLLARKGQTMSVSEFADAVLKPEQLTATDFENYVRHYVIIQQLAQTIGASGALVTPQEAGSLYQREHQELASQIIFFAAENYVSAVKVTPEALGQFYTNYLAEYRLPDRVQVNYVLFDITNYLAQSKTEWAKTNFEAQVQSVYEQYGTQAFPDAKTPEAAKDQIRDTLIRNKALTAARAQANEFAGAVFALTNAGAGNLDVVARQKGLEVRTTTPFSAETGPQEISASAEFAKIAFGLTPDEPFANPIVTTNGVYVIALARQLPSEIPPFADIRARVSRDYQTQQAALIAREAGTNFMVKLTVGMATGKSFAANCSADGLQPEVLPPFSLSTRELPVLGTRAELNQVKQAAFTTPVGHISNFQETADGGFLLYVQSQLPVDQAVMNAELPQFTESLRRSRENEAFNEWLNGQITRVFANFKVFQRDAAR
jgi:peptidyl-prolyl cis-trans isomerase D